MEFTKSKQAALIGDIDVAETPDEEREFDEILEQAVSKLVEMARLAREAKREGQVMKFPA